MKISVLTGQSSDIYVILFYKCWTWETMELNNHLDEIDKVDQLTTYNE